MSHMSQGKLARSVSIISTAYSHIGDVRKTPQIKDLTERELFAASCMETMKKGNIRARDIDAYYVGVSGPNFSQMKSAAAWFGTWIGMEDKPTLFHDEGCATSVFGLEQAVLAVASGRYDTVLSGAVNINSCVQKPGMPPQDRVKFDNDALWASVYAATDTAYVRPGYGGVGPTEAVLASYAAKYGLAREQIDDSYVGYLTSKRREALLNPRQTRVTMSYEDEAKAMGFDSVRDYLTSDVYNPYLGLLVRAQYLGQILDGSSAVIVCATDKAREYVEKPIEVAGVATIGIMDYEMAEFPFWGDELVFKRAYQMAGITDPATQVDYLGVHDCPASMVLPVSEESGYIPAGQAWKYAAEGEMAFDGAKPVTTSGGRTQSGHPRSPAFIIEVEEAMNQMRGENGARQMPKAPKTSVVWGGGAGYNVGCCVLKSLGEE